MRRSAWSICSGLLVACGGGSDPAAEELPGVLEAHNVARRDKGVPELAWDPALAQIAAAWASECRDVDAPAGLVDHNADRSDTYPEYVGENIFGASAEVAPTDAVVAWLAEEADYQYPANTCASVCGHYTQVVWRTTTKVGCAAHTCADLRYGVTVVCNYAQGGNSGGLPY